MYSNIFVNANFSIFNFPSGSLLLCTNSSNNNSRLLQISSNLLSSLQL